MINKGANKVMECFGVKAGEKVLIIVDTKTPLSIGSELFEAARKIGCDVMILTMLPRSRHGEEIPEPVAQAMKNSDVVIAPTTFSLTHTQAKINACKAGARVASMPGITENMMASGGMIADYDRINEIAIDLNKKLEKARNIAEFGIGINPEASLIGNVLEDEKVGGTVHIALGDNSTFGGDVVAGIHLDGIIKEPHLYVDGEKFILSFDN